MNTLFAKELKLAVVAILVLMLCCCSKGLSPVDPPVDPPDNVNDISVKVTFEVSDIKTKVFAASRALNTSTSIEKKVDNAWIVTAKIVESDTTIVDKTQLISSGSEYTATVPRKLFEQGKVLFYFIGNADLIENFQSATKLKELWVAKLVESKTSGVEERCVMATRTGIIPQISSGSVTLSSVILSPSVGKLELYYQNTLESIESLTIDGTLRFGSLRGFLDSENSSVDGGDYVMTVTAPEIGGPDMTTDVGYCYIYPNGNHPITVKAKIGGVVQSVFIGAINAGECEAILISNGFLLGFSSGSVVFQNKQFTAPSSESVAALTVPSGASISFGGGAEIWIKMDQTKSITSPATPTTKTIRIYANTSSSERSGTIVLTEGTKSEQIPITQKGKAVNVADIEYIRIPAGAFYMGSPESEPERDSDEVQHLVTITQDYDISKCEISNEQYIKFLNAKNVGADGKLDGNTLISGSKELQFVGGTWKVVAGKERYPVVYVSWIGALAFASWAGGKLPTEAQWEYACRGEYPNKASEKNTKPFGLGSGNTLYPGMSNFAWLYRYSLDNKGEYFDYSIPSSSGTKPVGFYTTGSYGLNEMHGNVWEWCSDLYDANYGSSNAANPVTDPIGGTSGTERMLKGGSWFFFARCCRSAYRMHSEPEMVNSNIGFRIIR